MPSQNAQTPASNGSQQAATTNSPATEANELTSFVNDLLHELTVGFAAHNAEMNRLFERMEERIDRLENGLIAAQNEQSQQNQQNQQNQQSGPSDQSGSSN